MILNFVLFRIDMGMLVNMRYKGMFVKLNVCNLILWMVFVMYMLNREMDNVYVIGSYW